MIPLIQIEGIKFTSRSFDVELKYQIMVLEDKDEVSFIEKLYDKRQILRKITRKTLEDDRIRNRNSDKYC